MRHYKQWRRTGEDPTPAPVVGAPDGFGRFGVMERHEDTAVCHECGAWVASVGNHAFAAHGITAAEYRRRHGLARGQALTALSISREQSARVQDRIGSAGWRRMEEKRDPAGAARARDAETLHRSAPAVEAERRARGEASPPPPWYEEPRPCVICGKPVPSGSRGATCSPGCRSLLVARRRDEQTRVMTATERAQLRELAPGPGLDTLVRRLQRDRVASQEIGDVLGHSPSWMTRHYPRR